MKLAGRAPIAGLACALAVVLAVAGACGGDDTPAPSPTLDSPTDVTRDQAGVRLTMSVDREVYQADQPVMVQAEVENITSFSITYQVRPSREQPFRLAVLSNLNAPQPLGVDAPADEAPGLSLAPGEKITRSEAWDQQLGMYQTPVQAPPGQYTIVADLVVLPSDGGEPVSVAGAINIQLEGGEPIVSSEEAIRIAIAQQSVKDWFAVRSLSLVCFDGNRDLFYIADAGTGNVAETLHVFYQAQLDNGQAICSPVTEGDAWRLIFFSPEGPPPSRISAFLELHSGKFLRVEEGGPNSTPPPTPGN